MMITLQSKAESAVACYLLTASCYNSRLRYVASHSRRTFVNSNYRGLKPNPRPSLFTDLWPTTPFCK
jgi:hypothetical protein